VVVAAPVVVVVVAWLVVVGWVVVVASEASAAVQAAAAKAITASKIPVRGISVSSVVSHLYGGLRDAVLGQISYGLRVTAE
jgi:hypothetical protein